MSVNTLEGELLEVSRLIQEAQARKEKIAAALEPYIHSYFTGLVTVTTNAEERREYAAFNKAKHFDIINDDTLRFHAKNWSGQITYDVKISQLLG